MPGSIETFDEKFFKEPADLPLGEIVQVVESVNLPADMPIGKLNLAIGVVGEYTNKPILRLAIKGRTDNGWYPLSELEISN